MLNIRPEQMERLTDAVLKRFEEKMLPHLRAFFPREVGALGEEKTRALIQYGVQRSAAYKITTERDICKYIDLMMVLGHDFDADPRFPWAARILSANRPPGERIERVCKAAESLVKES